MNQGAANVLKRIKNAGLGLCSVLVKFQISHHKKHPVRLTAQEAEAVLNRVRGAGSSDQKAGTGAPLLHQPERKSASENQEEMPDLSLIIPVYNAGSYLKECMESLLQQKTTYRYELICVDDGSTDASGALLDQYAERYSPVKVIHQKNGGISAARNRGLEESKGRYVGFIDNDDTVSDAYVQTIMNAALSTGADFVKTGYAVCHEPEGYRTDVTSPWKRIESGRTELLQFDGYIWGGCQKRTLWSDVRFPDGYWYEDMITRFLLFRKCRCFVNLPEILYFKREHGSNASRTLWKKKDVKCLDQYFLVKELLTINTQIGLGTDELLYRILLSELGVFLHRRTGGLDQKIREAAFAAASELIHRYRPEDSAEYRLTEYETNVQRSFQNRDFRLWELAGIQYMITYR